MHKESKGNNTMKKDAIEARLKYFKLKFGVKDIDATLIHLMDIVEYQDIEKRNPKWRVNEE